MERVYDGERVVAERDLPVVRIAAQRAHVRNAFGRDGRSALSLIDHARHWGWWRCHPHRQRPEPQGRRLGFLLGGDQRIRGRDGYKYDGGGDDAAANAATRAETSRAGRLHILEVQRLMRTSGMIFISAISGWATGGGTRSTCWSTCPSLHRATRASCRSMRTSALSTAMVRPCWRARWATSGRARFSSWPAVFGRRRRRWGVVSEAVAHAELEDKALEYVHIMSTKSPQALRMLRFAFNLADDGSSQQVFAGEATLVAYMTAEAQEGRDAFLEKRSPDWSSFPFYA